MTATLYGISFSGDENILDIDNDDCSTVWNVLKTIEFYILKGWILWSTNYI